MPLNTTGLPSAIVWASPVGADGRPRGNPAIESAAIQWIITLERPPGRTAMDVPVKAVAVPSLYTSVWNSATTPRAISAMTACGSGSTIDGVRELRSGVGDGLEPLHRLGAEHESDVPRRDFVALTGHRSGGYFRVVKQDSRRLRGLEAQRGNIEKQRPASGRAYEWPAGEHGVTAPLELGQHSATWPCSPRSTAVAAKREIATGIVVL
jgi:hypothetical protein